MKKTIEQYFCDVCGEQSDVVQVNYPVIFHTDQTEGRSSNPYISQEKLELCPKCLERAVKIHGWGNQFEIKK